METSVFSPEGGGTYQVIDGCVLLALWQADRLMDYKKPKTTPCPGVNEVSFSVVYIELCTVK